MQLVQLMIHKNLHSKYIKLVKLSRHKQHHSNHTLRHHLQLLIHILKQLIFTHGGPSMYNFSLYITIAQIFFYHFIRNRKINVVIANHTRKQIDSFYHSVFSMRIVPTIYFIFIGIRFLLNGIVKN